MRFDIELLYDIMRQKLKQVEAICSEDIDEIIKSSLLRLHVFRCSDQLNFLATVELLPELLSALSLRFFYISFFFSFLSLILLNDLKKVNCCRWR